jgi:glycosyltransferase involved in cell wall biosynthesis
MGINTVALVISTYNRPNALLLTLESVMHQSQMPSEIVIADDGSSPETTILIEKYCTQIPVPLIHCWHPDNGFQLAMIRNKAIALSSSEYIISIDGDLILHKHFIRDHMRTSEHGCFIQGSRVLLSEQLTAQIEKDNSIPKLDWLSKGIKNRLNAIYNPIISHWLSKKQRKTDHMEGVRGCNMAFWRNDYVAVNGFNEDISGWGREDSELVVRFKNQEIQRKNLKFGGIVWHLFHIERSRESLSQNDAVLEKAICQRLSKCQNGINKYL